ncbi:MAG: formyltransferase [Steroidobacteraceae bacterium]
MTAAARAPRAVVFAYHDVGVRCLRTLLAHGVEVPLVLSHHDSPGETIWFESVAQHAHWHGIEVQCPADPNAADVVEQLRSLRPDFLFSFYYRLMLGPELLRLPLRGAYNVHGSLLPHYRGRVPVNWAVLHGERQTGATLHAMAVKPDAGDIVAQQVVPILPDDTAFEVFRKVAVAAELALDCALPGLIAGTAPHRPQDLTAGSYFGRRTARDGAIDWRAGALAAHNLIRAVAPPFPGAFTEAEGVPLRILRSLPVAVPQALARAPGQAPLLCWHHGALYALCHDGALRILQFEFGPELRSADAFHRRYGERALRLKPVME